MDEAADERIAASSRKRLFKPPSTNSGRRRASKVV